jgi:hypothetical protein
MKLRSAPKNKTLTINESYPHGVSKNRLNKGLLTQAVAIKHFSTSVTFNAAVKQAQANTKGKPEYCGENTLIMMSQ